MNMSCGVIRDLLPLVAEDLAGEESKALVGEHLEECPACRKMYEELKTPPAPAPDGAEALRAVKKEIRRKRLTAVLLAALLVFLPLFALYAYCEEEQFLPYTEGLICVDGIYHPSPDVITRLPFREDRLRIVLNDWRINLKAEYCVDEITGEVTLVLQAWRYRIGDGWGGVSFADGSVTRYYPMADRVIYGFGEEQVLLYGEPMNGGVQVLPRLALGYYLLISLVAVAVFGILWLCLRKKKAASALRAMFFAALSYPIGHLLVKGTQTMSFSRPRDLAFILIAAAAVWGLLMLGWAVLQRKRAEKA